MKQHTIDLIRIYKPKGRDWMNFKMKKNNPYTFHHIVKKEHNGSNDVTNGALLTNKAHQLLHIMENDDPLLFDVLNLIFKEINDSKKPPTEETKITVVRLIDSFEMKKNRKPTKEKYQKYYKK